MVQARNNSDFDCWNSNGRCKECLDFGHILKVKPTGFMSGLDVECEGKRRLRNWVNLITSVCTLVSYLSPLYQLDYTFFKGRDPSLLFLSNHLSSRYAVCT